VSRTRQLKQHHAVRTNFPLARTNTMNQLFNLKKLAAASCEAPQTTTSVTGNAHNPNATRSVQTTGSFTEQKAGCRQFHYKTLYQPATPFLSPLPTAMWTGPMLSGPAVDPVQEARPYWTPNVRGSASPAVSKKQTIRQPPRWRAGPSRPAFFLA
jgi:hypothetical protein